MACRFIRQYLHCSDTLEVTASQDDSVIHTDQATPSQALIVTTGRDEHIAHHITKEALGYLLHLGKTIDKNKRFFHNSAKQQQAGSSTLNTKLQH